MEPKRPTNLLAEPRRRPVKATPAAPAQAVAPAVVGLDDDRATDAALVGAKAAALARAMTQGLPVLPGFVVTTAVTASDPDGVDPAAISELERAWAELSRHGERTLVVRSSSTVEDGSSTSMAGMFTSLLDVRGWRPFLDAVATVLGSMKSVPGIEMAPMAVLVQPQLTARVGGVLFGADPVSGRTDRLVVAAHEGGPDRLVSGVVDGAQYLLSPRGRRLRADRPIAGFGRAQRRALARLAARVAEVFGGPQDVEWAIDEEGRLHLLQSRPITAVAARAEPKGPVLGPGPVAETFPDPLAPLEEELWVEPLRVALREALQLTGVASRRQVAGSPVVVTVGGRVAVDLGLLGMSPSSQRVIARFDPRPPARRLRAAWRVGRLRAALPAVGGDLVGEIDRQLLSIPPLDGMTDRQLLGLLRQTRQALIALHGYEVLAGQLVGHDSSGVTAASAALDALGKARQAGRSDDEAVAEDPVLLALIPPRIRARTPLPETAPSAPAASRGGNDGDDQMIVLREALRLRVRWVQELSARAAWRLGQRLASRGALPDAEAIRYCRLDELDCTGSSGSVCDELLERHNQPVAAPLPAAFRLTERGEVVKVERGNRSDGGGRGAGGGRGVGRVYDGNGMPEAGAILVVRNLDPSLASLLPHLGGLVAETGSVLSHLAILAREFGVPTVVNVPDALDRFRPGAVVVVDGTTGEVALVEEPPTPSRAEERQPEGARS